MINLDNRKKLALAITLYCSLLIFIIVIAQFDAISAIVNSILKVFSPVIIGFAVAYLITPIVNFFEKKIFRKIRNRLTARVFSAILTYLSVFGFVFLFAMLIIPRVSNSIFELLGNLDLYEEKVITIVNNVLAKLAELELISDQLDAGAILTYIAEKFSSGEEIAKTVLNYIVENYQKILVVPFNILVGLFISIYVVFTKERLGAQLKKFLAAVLNDKSYASFMKRLNKSHSTFGGYFTGVLLDAIFIGLTSFILMLIFNIPYASLISIILAITNIIPIFGPILGTIPCALFIFIIDPKRAIMFIILILVLQQIDGNIIAPKILGSSTGMSPLGVIISITVMGACFGFVGMLIGVPVFAVITTIISELLSERLKAKDLSQNTADYYPKNAVILPKNEEHVTLWEKISRFIRNLFAKIFKKTKKD